jgi:ankyrin repeat protein
VPHSYPAPTRTLPAKPNLGQLRKQAKELLKSYRNGEQAAVAEVERIDRGSKPASFALADAQRVLARAYGFTSWARLKHQVEGVTHEAFLAAVDAGDIDSVRRLARSRPELVNPDLAEFSDSPIHRAVVKRDIKMTRLLMQLGADARRGFWPHRDATSAYIIAQDRQYSEIVAAIEAEEECRRRNLSSPDAAVDSRLADVFTAIRNRRSAEAIRILQSDVSLVGSCDVRGATALHATSASHDAATVAWLLENGAAVDARTVEDTTPLDEAARAAGWSANDRFFPYMRNPLVAPEHFYEVVRLLREKGAELTPRAAVAIGDCEGVMQMHRRGQLKNEVEFYRGGLLANAVRVNHIEMVKVLLDLGLDPDEPATPTEDGGRSWGFPLWFAAVCGRHEIAELLLDRGADVNAIVHASADPLSCALETGDKKMESLLLRHGARMTVERVADSGDTETAQAILDGRIAGSSLNVAEPSPTDLAEQMLWAAGSPEIVRMCLPRMVRKRDDPWWNYVLMHATLPECFKLILEYGIDPNVCGTGGYTMLHHLTTSHATTTNELQRATMLLDAGASLEKRDILLQSTPLGWACRWGRKELVELFVARGADPVERNAEPWTTPLAWATKYGHEDIAAYLRSQGVDDRGCVNASRS